LHILWHGGVGVVENCDQSPRPPSPRGSQVSKSPFEKGVGGIEGFKIIIMQDNLRYNKNNKLFARGLRNNSTKGEIILWSKVLRARKMLGYQFNRQFAIDHYIVDFICRKLKLIIEIDGYSHNFKYESDLIRDQYFINYGYTILRFSEQQVKLDLDNVARIIENKIIELQGLSV
jgi:very-short-patch-repair endonuclease